MASLGVAVKRIVMGNTRDCFDVPASWRGRVLRQAEIIRKRGGLHVSRCGLNRVTKQFPKTLKNLFVILNSRL